MANSKVKPQFQNTWGDGLFVVFKDALECAELAVQSPQRIKQVKWQALGLPADTTVRIAVHFGPVFRHLDKIIGRNNYFGSQVNRTARIEPVTTPDCIFASEQFAAELAVHKGHPFRIEFVGIETLAKSYDRCALYQLDAAGS